MIDLDNFEEIDQTTLVIYGLTKPFDHYVGKIHPIEKASFFTEDVSPHLKLLAILDKQDEATLKLIYTYLELRLNIAPSLPFPK